MIESFRPYGLTEEEIGLLCEGLHNARSRAKDRMKWDDVERCDNLLRKFGAKPPIDAPKRVWNNAAIDEACIRARTHVEQLEAAYKPNGLYGTLREQATDIKDLLEITQHVRDEFGKLERAFGEILKDLHLSQERHMQNLADIKRCLGAEKLGEDKPAKPVTG